MTISMDSLFMVPEEIDETMDAVLLVYDANRKNMWTMAVDGKGATPASVKWVSDKLEEVGYAGVEVTLKSDQEPAMLSLKQVIAIRRKAETPMIESPVRGSKSNGKIERAIRSWQAQFMTMRHHLESRLKAKVQNNSA